MEDYDVMQVITRICHGAETNHDKRVLVCIEEPH